MKSVPSAILFWILAWSSANGTANHIGTRHAPRCGFCSPSSPQSPSQTTSPSPPTHPNPISNRQVHSQLKFRLNMCQLLGMNCATPTDFHFSFLGFSRRGGATDKHSDGWGLAFFDGRGVRAFHDSASAVDSPVAEMVRNYPVKTLNMISHIRYATAGTVCLANVHPFQREMWGINWVFAHNGDLPKFSNTREFPWMGQTQGEKIYYPVGATDSEAVFCSILNALRAMFKTLPTLPVLYDAIQSLCCEITRDDPEAIFNFLLMCGEYTQFAYSWPGSRPGSNVWNGLYYTIREPPFKSATLKDMDYSLDFAQVTTGSDRVAVIATSPLTTNEAWVEVQKGQLLLFDEGLPYAAAQECAKVEEQGRGLSTAAKEMIPGDIVEAKRTRSVLYSL